MRTDSTLGVIFFTRRKRNNPYKLDIHVRIMVNKQRSELSIKRDITVCNWDIFRCRVFFILRPSGAKQVCLYGNKDTSWILI